MRLCVLLVELVVTGLKLCVCQTFLPGVRLRVSWRRPLLWEEEEQEEGGGRGGAGGGRREEEEQRQGPVVACSISPGQSLASCVGIQGSPAAWVQLCTLCTGV